MACGWRVGGVLGSRDVGVKVFAIKVFAIKVFAKAPERTTESQESTPLPSRTHHPGRMEGTMKE